MESRPWKILLVEDDEDDYILTRDLLAVAREGQFELEWASNYESSFAALQSGAYDAILADYDLGARTGLDLVREAASLGSRAPVILLTGRGSYEVDVEAMRAGVSDYLVKGQVNALLLERTIRYAIDRKQAQEALRRANDELEARVQQRTQELKTANRELQIEIEERRRIQEALQEEQARLGLFLAQLPAIVWSTDTQLIFTSAQGRGLLMLGQSGGGFIGKSVEQISDVSSGAREVFLTAHRRAVKGDSVFFEMTWNERYYRCFVEPFYNAENRLIGCIGLALDQTEARRMEAELAEVQRRLIESTEAERLQLAQELHDVPMQELYALSYQLQVLNSDLPSDERRIIVAQAQRKIQEINQVLRSTAGELRPPTLTPYGLEKAIRSYAETFQQNHPEIQLDLDLQSDGQLLPERVRLALFRICQVSLTNIIRHSQASQASIRLILNEKDVMLEVKDNGLGFQVPPRLIFLARQGHLGLVGASERAEAVGGRLEVRSRPGEGATVRVVAPLQLETSPS